MTQGLVSFRHGGRVVLKIVSGCDGMHAEKVGERIKKVHPVSLKEAYHLALGSGLGCRDCLVAMNSDHAFFEFKDEELSTLYRETFDDPEFNPRWDLGTSDYTCVVDIGEAGVAA